jgi:hypothetical protein
MFWRFSFALVLVLLPTTTLAQNLTQEAGNFSAQDFYPRWLNTPCGWWVYYEVPPTSQTQPTIRRYVQATEVAPAVTEKALTQDDIANGLQFMDQSALSANLSENSILRKSGSPRYRRHAGDLFA